jgi:hypothetical protein
VTVGELVKWTLVRQWGPRRVGEMQAFLDALVVLPYDYRVAARRGELQAFAHGLTTTVDPEDLDVLRERFARG